MNAKPEGSAQILKNAYDCIDQIVALTEQHEESAEENAFIHRQLLEAKLLFEKLDESELTSQALLRLGWMYFKIAHYEPERTSVKSQLELAISTLDKAILAIDSTEHTDLCIEGYLLEIECFSNLSRYQQMVADREDCLGKALNLANACKFLCFQSNNAKQQAKLAYLTARINGEYYKTDRDSNLLDGIRSAQLSLDIMKADPEKYPIHIPTLYNDIGNFYAKLSGDRTAHLEKAKVSYTQGLNCAKPTICPQLHSALSNNIQWLDSILSQGNTELPMPEMVARYKTKIQEKILQKDIDQALQISWAFLQRSWSLLQTPNAAAADAHLNIGNLIELKYGANEAIGHYFSAFVIVGHKDIEFSEKSLFFAQTQQTLQNALKQASQSKEIIQGYLASAENAMQTSFELCYKSKQLLDSSDLQGALDSAIEATSWYPFNPYAYFYQGISFLRAQDFAQAKQAFAKSININPNDKLTWLNSGFCNNKLGEFDTAIKDYEQAITLDTNNFEAMNQIINIYIQQKQYEKCFEKLDQYISQFPNKSEFFQMRSYCNDKLNRHNEAIEDLETAIELCDNEDLKPKMVKALEFLK